MGRYAISVFDGGLTHKPDDPYAPAFKTSCEIVVVFEFSIPPFIWGKGGCWFLVVQNSFKF